VWVTRGGGLIIELAWESAVMHDAPTPLLILNNAMGKVNKQPQWEFTHGVGVNQTGGMGINYEPSLAPPIN